MRKPYQEKITLDHIRKYTSLCFYQELNKSFQNNEGEAEDAGTQKLTGSLTG